LRRTGFGPTASEVDAATVRGYAATVDQLLDFSSPDPADAIPLPAFSAYRPTGVQSLTADQPRAIQKERASDNTSLIEWWLTRMATTSRPLREKLTWFWHGHFATSIDKVTRAAFMANQNQILRDQGAANFEAMTLAVAKDPAMLVWLDAATNVKANPNENFSRELMELHARHRQLQRDRRHRGSAGLHRLALRRSVGEWSGASATRPGPPRGGRPAPGRPARIRLRAGEAAYGGVAA
jgi:hypothetical protein